MVNSLLIYASQIFPDWNVTSEGDFGVVLLELFSYCGDILSYYTDRVAQEAYLPTATQRQSLLNIAQLLGYTPSNGTPAQGTVTFITNNPGPAVVLPQGLQVQSNFNNALDAPIIYQTTEVATCPANGGTVTVPVTQGITFTLIPIGTSTGLPGQVFQLPQTEVLDGSTTVYIQSNAPGGQTQWNQVTSFVNAQPSDTSFTLFVDANDVTNITFGDGVNGLIPALGLTIYATYTVIAGSAGNQPAGAVNVIVDSINGVAIAYNAAGIAESSIMSGGSDPESNDSIRANAPTAFATQGRAVSLADYANLALNVPGVVSANAVANHSTSVSLYILGPNATVATGVLNDAVLTAFEDATLAGVTLSLPTPNLIAVDVGSSLNSPANYVTLQVLPTYSQQATVNGVILALNAFLTPPSTTFGMLLNVSQLYQVIMAVPGVEYVVIPVFTREDVVQNGVTAIQFRQSEIPVAGNYYISAQGGM
jgi:predicted phage baseplate assembly protein